MTVVVSGASGLIGRALVESLRADGVEVKRLVRSAPQGSDEVQWAPGEHPLDPAVLEGAAAVVNLNGANIGKLPWSKRYKGELRTSRLQPTHTIAQAIRELGADAPAFVSASAVGWYGSQPGIELDEAAGKRGRGFLPELCFEWENAALLGQPHARVATLRTAPIIHPEGVLKPMITLTKLGVAGPLGGGDQVWPWITLDDEVRAIRHILDSELEGPVNLCGPTRATANDIGRALAKALRRPFWAPVPAAALKAVLGKDAADGLLLADADVRPAKLVDNGFDFLHPTVEDAVASCFSA